MGRERQQVISSLYHEALARKGDERERFLREACPDDDLRAEIESLLKYEQKADQFLEGGVPSIVANPASQGGDTTPPAIGRLIGSMEILSLIGAGGMGLVYRARDTRLGRHVALKILPPHLTDDSERAARFDREARLLATLNHPNIGAIYGIEEAGGVRALVLELVEGETLADLLRRKPLSVDQAINIARQIAGALKAAHSNGVIHRDLKPANIGITPDGVVKILDFGLAKTFPAHQSASQASQPATITALGDNRARLGTPAYMSPEQVRGLDVDGQSDIWAFGCVLYEMLAGRRPFEGDDIVDILASIVAREPRWDVLDLLTPSEIHRLVQRCLDRTPERRPDITDVIGTLDDTIQRRTPSLALKQSSTSPPPGSTSSPTDSHRPREHKAAPRRLQVMGWPVLPLLLFVPVSLMAITSLGFISSTAFNRTLGLSPRFGTESPGVWFMWGRKSLLAPAIYVLFATIAFLFVRRCKQALSARFSTIRLIDSNLSQGFRASIVALGLDDPYLLAPAVSILGAMALAVTLWRFADVITAFWYPINELLPEQVEVLRPGSPDIISYMSALVWLIIALALSVRYVFEIRRRAGIRDRIGWPTAGVVVLAVAVLFLEMPYRIMFHSRFDRITFRGNPCFVIGENRMELLLHCPTIPPPRNLGVKPDDPSLTNRSTPASVYGAAR